MIFSWFGILTSIKLARSQKKNWKKIKIQKVILTLLSKSHFLRSCLILTMGFAKLPVIGGIAIPEVEINLPIFKGLDNVNLFYGAGTMKRDQVMGKGNYSLASHHIFTAENASQMLFSPLSHAKNGMKIYLTDKDKVYTYVIHEVKHVTPDRVDEIDDRSGVDEITLVNLCGL